jgi:hypothetical protein
MLLALLLLLLVLKLLRCVLAFDASNKVLDRCCQLTWQWQSRGTLSADEGIATHWIKISLEPVSVHSNRHLL